MIPALGGPERKLAEILLSDNLPRGRFLTWSPDGNWLVISDRDSPKEPVALFLLSVESGEKRKLTTPPLQSTGGANPAFSPDGHALAFSRAVDYGLSDL